MAKITKEEALRYHAEGKPGKIEVIPTKPHSTQTDLSLAYSPGVAEPCLEIEKNPHDAYEYTAKGNLVAVISNGTAVLGLGDIGPLAGKPVMEGKGLLFKIFAGIDVFDIEVNEKDPEKFIQTVKAISPTFGGINLEDIKAPECFEIETRLKNELDIPVMHDDQHGTAIISGAGLINALEIAGKKIEDVKIVVNGAGAASISCTKLYVMLGARKENIVMCDINGIICEGDEGLNAGQEEISHISNRNHEHGALADALRDSCNIYFYTMGHRLGIDKIDEYASLFGLGEYTGIELPEVKGYVAGPATSEALGVEWYGGNLLNAAIGQDNTQVTPLQLANYIVTLLNGGDHFVPHLLKSVKSSDYSETVYEQQPEVKNHIALDPANVEAVKRGMWEVANDPKSTVDQYLSNLAVEVGAKTGSAQVGSADKEADAVFTLFAPYDDPEIVISIVVEGGASGGNLAQAAGEIVNYYFSAEHTVESVDAENTLLR